MHASSKIRRFLLTTAAAACAAPSAFAGQFSDTAGHWAENEGVIDRAVEEGIMSASWNINPQGNATRAESTKTMLVSLDISNGVETGKPLLKSHFLDAGQGDSCFVELSHGKSMLIDAGTAKSAQKIVSYIQRQGYDRIGTWC